MSLFDLSGVVSTLANETITVTRYSTSPFGSDGRAAAKTSSSFTTSGNAQPVSRTLDRDPQGFSETSDRLAVFTKAVLMNGDRLLIDGSRYEVESVDGWQSIGNFCESVARKLDPAEV